MVSTRRSSRQERKALYPFPENHIDDNTIQPYIHNCIITVHERQNSYRYMVFFKRHCHIRPSNSLHNLRGGGRPILKGDVIVMRIGLTSSYVNMRDRDTILADWFICKGMESVLVIGFSDCFQVLFFRFTQEAMPSQILDLPQELAFY